MCTGATRGRWSQEGVVLSTSVDIRFAVVLRSPASSTSTACLPRRAVTIPPAITGAACETSGVLGRQGYALDRAAPRCCPEAGGWETCNVFRDLDLGAISLLWIPDASRSWLTCYHCFKAPRRQLTRLSFLRCTRTELQKLIEQCCHELARSGTGRIQKGGAIWLSLPVRLGARDPMKPKIFVASSQR